MSVLKAALLQMEVQQEIPDSLARAERLVRQAKEQGAQLALLPEMFCCPYQTPNFPVYAQPQGRGGLPGPFQDGKGIRSLSGGIHAGVR